MPNRHPTSSPISSRPSRPRVRIIPYNYIRFGTTPSGLEIEIKLSCFYAIGKEEEGGKEWKTERERKRNGRTRTRRDRAARLEGKEREKFLSSRLLRDEPTMVFCSREAKVPLPALSSCFSACPTPKSARLNLPWNFGAHPPAMQRTLPRGRPFVMLFYVSRNKTSTLRAQFCIFRREF